MLLSIGDSRMTFLTVKALRHYHDVPACWSRPCRPPERATAHTAPEQVAQARLIRRLVRPGPPVDEVRVVLSAPDEESRNA